MSTNDYRIPDVFQFTEEIQRLQIDENDFFVSFDVTALVTNVPLGETIRNSAEKTFTDIYFKNVQNLNINRELV